MTFKQSKLYNWEYWPFWLFYFPVYVQVIWYAIRSGTFAFFSAANPIMEMGGFVNYSKFNVLKHLPTKVIPKTRFYKAKSSIDQVINDCETHFSYPVILKPDRGERGFAVNYIENQTSLRAALERYTFDFLLQEFINHPLEYGVMYSRHPDATTGKIDSIVQKDFLTLIGDGRQSLKNLLLNHERGKNYIDHITKYYIGKLSDVPKSEEIILLEPIGNHSRGTTFLNANDLISEKLVKQFDSISRNIPGFYFGRFDLRVESIEKFQKGATIKILEVNGANSEPAHIYDPNTSLLDAYRHLFAHWRNLFEISRANHKLGIPYMGSWQGYLHLKKHLKQKSEFEVSE